MNPPSALYGAMNKDRKPFTYTPGGLDLSEIKSERMAQRLMRNAMSQGVPETQVQALQSPPTQINSSAIPNFNCLPVQVFPTFPLPANPKSLLRSISNPDAPKEAQLNKKPVPSSGFDDKHNADQSKSKHIPSLFTLNNNGEALSTDTKRLSNNGSFYQPTNYGSDGQTEIILPEKSYDAEYFVLEPQGNIKLIDNDRNKLEENARSLTDIFVDTAIGIEKTPVALTSSSMQDRTTNDFEQKKVKIVKKQTKTSENEADQNGDTQAAVVVKLPSKKSSAKTETKVEVVKKILPDGTTEEVKTTITKTTLDGKTEIKTETETRTIPKEQDDDIVEIEEQEEESEDVAIEENESEQNEEEEIEESTTFTTNESSKHESKESEENIKTEIKENGHIISGEEKVEISTTKNVVVFQSTDQESEEEPQEEEDQEEKEDVDVEVEQVIVLKKVTDNSTKQSKVEERGDKLEKTISLKDDKTEEIEDEEQIEDENVLGESENISEEVNKDVPEQAEEVEAEEVETEEVEAEEVEAEEVEAEEVEAEEVEEVEAEEVEAEEVEAEEVEAEEVEAEEVEAEEVEAEEVEAEEDVAEDVKTKGVESEEVAVMKEQNVNVDEQGEAKNILLEHDASTISCEEKLKPKENSEQNQNEAENVTVKTDMLEENEPIINKDTQNLNQKCEPSQKGPTHQEISTESSFTKDDITKKQVQTEQERVLNIKIQSEPKVSFREPSIPLEKVEDVEIKPIGPAQEIIKKCHTEIITTTKDEPTGALSTQTNYNRIENIVTVNRTTKTLDHAYEQAEPTIPGVKTYFIPPTDRILSTPQPISRSYQPVFTPEPQTERRHSLLLDRLSIERQIPVQQPNIYPNNYQLNNQNYEHNQWSQEPQSEVLTVSNVKPSEITKNQQWYQQTKREENYTSNIVTPTPVMPSQLSQQQPQAQVQAPYQSYVQPQYTPTPEFYPSYTDNSQQNSFKSSTTNYQQNTNPSYAPKPSWVSSTVESKPTPATQFNQYSTLKKESNENYQKSTQPFSSSYVPPPWEQDSSYVVENQGFYQPPPTSVYTPITNQSSWKPTQPASKFSKPTPNAYIPPAPNQSFVKPVSSTDSNLLPGRKTYYSEYERRYISVPESTYIPSETKYEAQPDPSPQYYYDNNESTETVEPQWRKELREFTEKTSQTTLQTEKTSVRPPWEEDPKYATGYTSTVTKSWTQSLRPRSWRETSYEPEYIGSKEWPKTNTLGRGRPQSSYVRNNVDTIRERTRGVSVDRYNPNSYQSPLSSEHPPVQSHTLNPNSQPKAYHNPSVPAYHARNSAESREQAAPYIQRTWGESKAPPVQSRSFKYLQWITGTED